MTKYKTYAVTFNQHDYEAGIFFDVELYTDKKAANKRKKELNKALEQIPLKTLFRFMDDESEQAKEVHKLIDASTSLSSFVSKWKEYDEKVREDDSLPSIDFIMVEGDVFWKYFKKFGIKHSGSYIGSFFNDISIPFFDVSKNTIDVYIG